MLADPRLRSKLNIRIGFIIKEKEINCGKRLTVIIPQSMDKDIQRKLYDDSRRMLLYIQQEGRGSIIGLDECIFKIRKKVRLNYNGRYAAEAREIAGTPHRLTNQRPKMVKVDIEKIELEDDHFEALQEAISKVL